MVEANGEFAFSKVSILTGKGKWGDGFWGLGFGVWVLGFGWLPGVSQPISQSLHLHALTLPLPTDRAISVTRDR